MPTGQFEQPKPNKLIAAMQSLAQKQPVGTNRLYVSVPQHYIGTYVGAEILDANLAIVRLQGGTTVRFVPTLGGLSLSPGNVVKLEKSSSMPLHVTGVLRGDFRLATQSVSIVTAPGPATSYAHGTATTSQVTVTWSAGVDHFGSGLSYQIFVNGAFRQSTAVGALSATITGLTASKAYTSYVVSSDGAGSSSSPSNTISFTTADVPPASSGTTVTKTYKATLLRSYNYDGQGELDTWHNGLAYQGDDQGGGHNQTANIFFDDVTIRADCKDADMVSAKVGVTYAHWWYSSGGIAVIGTHDYHSVPNPQSSSHCNLNLIRVNNKAGTRISASYPAGIADDFQSGAAKGIHIGPALTSGGNQTTDPTYYGYTYGIGSYTPTLTLTWVTN